MALKTYWIAYLLFCVVCLPPFAQSQTGSYQAGTITKVDQLPDTGSTGHTDASLKSEVHDYNVSIQVGDTLYVCRYHTPAGHSASWSEGKEVQVRVKGKSMYVKKANGKDEKTTIVNTTKAGQP